MTETMGPLTGIKIVELAGIGAGPHCAMMFADMGADVIRVDRTSSSSQPGFDVEAKYDLLLRGRRSIAIDMKRPEGRDAVLRLVDKADALMESFRPGVAERLGLGPDACLSRNPKLVYGRLTGWGQSGPYAQMAGHDINFIALAGVLDAIGSRQSGPTPPLNLVGDFGGGALYFGFGMLCALLEAMRSGRGQVVDGAMVDGAAGLMTMVVGLDRAGLWSEQRGDNIIDGAAPFYRTYKTADGKYIAIGAIEQKFYRQLLEKLNLDKDPEMSLQMEKAKWRVQEDKIALEIAKRTRDEWCELLEGTDVCFAPVLSIREVADHPHIKARGTYVDINGVSQPAPAPRFSRTIPCVPARPCLPGDHSRAILSDFGFETEEIEKLCKKGIVMQRGNQI